MKHQQNGYFHIFFYAFCFVELYAVYVAEWEEFSKKLVVKFDKKGIFVK
jgi:hypothetical protein